MPCVLCFFLFVVFIVGGQRCFADEYLNRNIGFSAFIDGYWQICVMNLHDGKIRQLTKSSSDKKEPLWFDKGQQFIYRTGNAELYLFDINKGSEKRFAKQFGNIFDPDFSADNRYLLFTRFRADITDSSDIWLSDLSGGKVRKLTNAPGLQYDPVWSPDRKKIVYVSSESRVGHNLRMMNSEGKNHIWLTQGNFYNISPDWSPDGKQIIFSSDAAGNYDIWEMDCGEKNRKKLTDDRGLDIQPALSPDGKEILFVSNRLDILQIWIMKRDGSDQRPLTPGKMKCSDPVWIELKIEMIIDN